MNTLAAELVLALLLLLLGAAGGYTYATHNGDVALGQAQSDTAVCTATAQSQAAALKRLQGLLTDQRTRHDQMLHDAEATLAGRDAAIQSLQDEAERLRAAITGATRHAECADLARLPVCAAVDERLWPAATGARGARAPRGD